MTSLLNVMILLRLQNKLYIKRCKVCSEFHLYLNSILSNTQVCGFTCQEVNAKGFYLILYSIALGSLYAINHHVKICC